jgi:hypothetical protein
LDKAKRIGVDIHNTLSDDSQAPVMHVLDAIVTL